MALALVFGCFFENKRRINNIKVNGDMKHRLPNTLSVSFDSIDSESAILYLDREGIAVSSGSACTSGSIEASHVLKALKIRDNLAKGTLRFSLGKDTGSSEIDKTIEALVRVIGKLRKINS